MFKHLIVDKEAYLNLDAIEDDMHNNEIYSISKSIFKGFV